MTNYVFCHPIHAELSRQSLQTHLKKPDPHIERRGGGIKTKPENQNSKKHEIKLKATWQLPPEVSLNPIFFSLSRE